MKKWIKRSLVTVASIVLIVLFGCSALMDAVTPCFIEQDAIKYADVNPKRFMPYTSLWDSEWVVANIDFNHDKVQRALARLSEDDNLEYTFLKGTTTSNMQQAMEFQQAVFTPEGPIGLALPFLTGGALGALLIKRPGDKSEKELNAS